MTIITDSEDLANDFVAKKLEERIREFWRVTGRSWPDVDEGLHFIAEELGEASSAWNTIKAGARWVRNNPDDHQETMADLASELGDIALMALVTSFALDSNAIAEMLLKIDRKFVEWITAELHSPAKPSEVFGEQFFTPEPLMEWFDTKELQAWFPEEDLGESPPDLGELAESLCLAEEQIAEQERIAEWKNEWDRFCAACEEDPTNEPKAKFEFLSAEELEELADQSSDYLCENCNWSGKCAAEDDRDITRDCVEYWRVLENPELAERPTTNSCQRRRLLALEVEHNLWICESPSPCCWRLMAKNDLTDEEIPLCAHLDEESYAPLVDSDLVWP